MPDCRHPNCWYSKQVAWEGTYAIKQPVTFIVIISYSFYGAKHDTECRNLEEKYQAKTIEFIQRMWKLFSNNVVEWQTRYKEKSNNHFLVNSYFLDSIRKHTTHVNNWSNQRKKAIDIAEVDSYHINTHIPLTNTIINNGAMVIKFVNASVTNVTVGCKLRSHYVAS